MIAVCWPLTNIVLILCMYCFDSDSWHVRCSESGSMTKELFADFCQYFIKVMEGEGYGSKHSNPLICLLDGHSSRWTHFGLQLMIEHGFYPFCIGSHTSAWDQPNDNGFNAMFKAVLGRTIHEWRINNPFSVFDRCAFNACVVKTMQECRLRLAAELAAWKAKKAIWLQHADEDSEPLSGKPGNVVTRTYERTGW